MTSAAQLMYIGDPMCSWCWGFAPVLDAVRQRYLPRIGFRLILGGLRPGPAAAPLDAAMKAYLRQAWEAVQARSGQPFAWDLLQRDDFLYDTGPASRAVVSVRRIDPTREYAFFRAIQEAFYARNDDVTRPEVLAVLARDVGVGQMEFRRTYAEELSGAMTAADFAAARKLDVAGFPTLLLSCDARLYPIARGYQPYERVEPVLRGLLAGA